jgi:DNA mismatch endonuclease (patch repair protein)
MVDKITPEERSDNMRSIKSKDTSPELIVRRLVHRMGYRYRLHRKDLVGKPDLTFVSRKKIIFVHGCFWHQHNEPACKISRLPRSNTEYWIPKLKKNIERDKHHYQQLTQLEWKVLIVWECETKDINKLAEKITRFLGQCRVSS